MFERFTESARQVVVLAQEEARALRHNYIGTEHILLGLIREKEGLAARALKSLDITIERLRAEVVRLAPSSDQPTAGMMPFSAAAKRVLERSLHEALRLGRKHIGTEHILLGLIQDDDDLAVGILLALGADADKVRNEIIRTISGPRSRAYAEVKRHSSYAAPDVVEVDSAWLDRLARLLDRLTAEVRRELGREPDSGDLLLALGCAADTPAGRSLRELGINLDELQSTIQRTRAQEFATDEDRIEEVRQEKERAIESNQPEIAARLRDEERRLTKARHENQQTLLSEIRRRLGLPAPPGVPKGPPA